MAKPVILTVDDDAAVARAIERDLRRRFGERFRIVRAESGEEGLDVLRRLKLRDDKVALLLADQRMPRMSGVEFLGEALGLFPDARRALLTAYADSEAAIRAINEIDLDFYLRKPWEPPDQNLYPVVEDLLDRWAMNAPADREEVRLVGPRFLAESHTLRDLLARNGVAYRWIDVEAEEARQLLAAASVSGERMPVAFLDDGSVLEAPTQIELAEKLGRPTRAEQSLYDLVVVGGGPAGLAAGVYGGSEGLRTLIVEREAPGGQAGQSSRIENYLGFPNGLPGRELAERAYAQARRFGTEVLGVQRVTAIEPAGSAHDVRLSDGTSVRAHAVVLATGVAYRKLDAPGVADLTGAGIYYGAAMTEGAACRNEDVVIVGGANSAGQAAMYFAGEGARVTMLVRRTIEEGMSQYLVDRIHAHEAISVRPRTQVVAAEGNGRLQGVRVTGEGGEADVSATAMFIFIGARPETDWLDGRVARDERGFILSGPDLGRPRGWPLQRDPFLLETSSPGVFVAGDVRHGSVKRVASSVGEGAMAVRFVHEHLAGVNW